MKKTLACAYIVLAMAVVLGAFGAHALEGKISENYLHSFRTANLYHFIHGIGMVITSFILYQMGSKRTLLISNLFLVGIIIFSGSLYVLSVWELLEEPALRKLGAITPIGGVIFVLAWLLAAAELIRMNRLDKIQHPEEDDD